MIETSIKLKVNKDYYQTIKRALFPLTLSWACTVHKVQGLSLEKAVISLDLIKQISFNYGQIYICGLSRVTNLKGLFLTGEYKSNSIKSDPKPKIEYDWLQKGSIMKPCEDLTMTKSSLTFSLLDTRSLPKHVVDIANDSIIYASDIMCLTETQIVPAIGMM